MLRYAYNGYVAFSKNYKDKQKYRTDEIFETLTWNNKTR